MPDKKFILSILIALPATCWAQQNPPRYVSETEGISFQELAHTALNRNRDLAAARESLRQAEARLTQSRLRPNPALDASRTTDAMFANDGDTALSIGISQTLELGGKRSKRADVEKTSIEIAEAQIADAERQLAGRLRAAFVEAVGAAARLDLFDRLDGLNRQMVHVMEVRLRSGDASRLDSQLLTAQTNQVRAERVAAENQLTGTMLQIRSLAGLSLNDPILLKRQEPAAKLPATEEAAVAAAFENRPDLRAARRREELEEKGITLARAQAVPNANAFVRYGRESIPLFVAGSPKHSFEQESVMEFGVSIPLPLFNREQGNIAEAASRRTQAREEREALETTIRREVVLAYRRYEASRRALEILDTGVLRPNQDSFRIVQLAYNLGDMRLLDIVNQQRIVIEAETSYVDTQTQLNAALADLELAMGVDSSN